MGLDSKGIAFCGRTLLTAQKRVRGDDGEYHDVPGEVRIVENKKVTQAFVEYVVDQLQTETSTFGDFKYHDSGTGTSSESPSDTALGTPTGIARATGTQTEDSASASTYVSVATITYDSSYAVTEHGLFNAASSGTLMDRTKFAALNMSSGEQIQFTFSIQFSAEA